LHRFNSEDPFLKIFAVKQPDSQAVGFGLPQAQGHGHAPPKKAKKAAKPKYVLIAKTEVIKSNLNPRWAPLRLDVRYIFLLLLSPSFLFLLPLLPSSFPGALIDSRSYLLAIFRFPDVFA
jgi:hypothetical protein